MLVFFIHGVATRDARYAHKLQTLIRQELTQRKQPLPHFHAGFWGDILNDLGRAWNWIHQDLQAFQTQHPQANLEEVFRYQALRRGFLSEFVGDTLTYLNSDRGAKIRERIATQLEDFLDRYPEETELHIVAHSLGTVILWDTLFSEKLDLDEASIRIRALIKGFGVFGETGRVILKSITTMGSPILLFNLMLEILPERIQRLTSQYHQPLNWTNLIHSSDIIAYPLQSSLNIQPSWNLRVHDRFIQSNANSMEKTLWNLIQSSAVQALGKNYVEILSSAPMLAGAADAHTNYWHCSQTTAAIVNNLLNHEATVPFKSFLEATITLLGQVTGMTEKKISMARPLDTLIATLSFRDQSGYLQVSVNPMRVHFVHAFDAKENCLFGGYVGWIHTDGLNRAIDLIKIQFCD